MGWVEWGGWIKTLNSYISNINLVTVATETPESLAAISNIIVALMWREIK